MVTTRVVTEFSAARAMTATPHTEQIAREIERVERLGRNSGQSCAYVVAFDDDGGACGFLPMYHTIDVVQLGSIGTMPSWALAHGGHRDETLEALFVTGIGAAPALGTGRITAPMLYDDQLDAVLAACRQAMPDVLPVQHLSHEGVIDVTFSSFDDYVASLPARQRQVRRQRRRFLESEMNVVEVSLTDTCADLAPLLAQVETKYGQQRTVEEYEAYLWTAGAAMGRHGRTLVVFEERRPVAFSCVWAQGDDWRMRFWGCDYTRPVVRDTFLYFNLNYYEPLIRAGQAGAQCLILGTGSLPTKQERGAWLRPLTTVELG